MAHIDVDLLSSAEGISLLVTTILSPLMAGFHRGKSRRDNLSSIV